jgi:DNA repair protein RadC
MATDAQDKKTQLSQTIDSSFAAQQILVGCFHSLQEEVWVLGLNSHLEVLTCQLLFRGTADTCLVHPRDLFRILVLANSTGFILAHNHPSGRPEPSKKDLDLTQQLLHAGQILEIPMIDHLILAGTDYFSFADSGLFNGKQGLGRRRYRYHYLD